MEDNVATEGVYTGNRIRSLDALKLEYIVPISLNWRLNKFLFCARIYESRKERIKQGF